MSRTGRRSNNEDSYLAATDLGLFAVADGVGGYVGGEIASRLAVDTLLRVFQHARRASTAPHGPTCARAPDGRPSRAEVAIETGVRLAARRIRKQRVGTLAAMSSTVAAIYVGGGRGVVAHVGDSRVYRLRGARLEQLTQDHSLYAALAAASSSIPARASFPMKNVITQALGFDSMHCDVLPIEVENGDVFLLCSDGLSDVLDENAIASVLAACDVSEAASMLVAGAYGSGSQDNITAVVVAVGERELGELDPEQSGERLGLRFRERT